ncbi:TIGR00730 family Rossman fold protein [Chitinophaga qingshengii]|uniref:Cytokinin riboside 5'-monophosphate phosphoribohydrolase n=1 Tax=Chitinophaga qingshengii TaxID=1569794 RepID=A0ABR7TIK7_9BACT|nr:TIGR00730 family Rossman fold protein [Chitinophaga qingshengii]MBC9930337.1 TIGR00730 family Rossman fold protein [Chitinophaga qingshengii]
MKNIVVFCGSSAGSEPVYMEQARQLGAILAQRGIGLVYGGAKVGLMGAVADGALQAGGKVTGVLPHFLQQKELAHAGLTELILVDTMHERKTKMNELSDGVIALPGGFGTMEELFEMLTWGQLGLHRKPIGMLNVNGFYDPLHQLSQAMTDKGFLSASNRDMLLYSDQIEDLLTRMEQYQPAEKPKWITPAQS